MIFVYTIYICYQLYCSMLQINHMIQKRSREYSRESLNVRPNSSEFYNWWDNLTQLSSCRSPAAQHLGFDSYGDLVPSEFMVSTPLIRGTSDDPGLFNKSLQCFMFNKKTPYLHRFWQNIYSKYVGKHGWSISLVLWCLWCITLEPFGTLGTLRSKQLRRWTNGPLKA